MIVPSFWAEARRQRRKDGRQVTVRRFGWSDVSDADAQAMADQRADEALVQAWLDKKVPRRDHKVAYNGAEGLPIREEIVARHGDLVITRNSYGARCLNTADVCFVDVDFESTYRPWLPGCVLWLAVLVSLVLLGLGKGKVDFIAWPLLVVSLAVLAVSQWLRVRARRPARARADTLARMAAFVRSHAGWGARVYETPAGLRLLVTHDPCDPTSDVVRDLFDAVRADKAYVRMCTLQRCFRARLTAKPWRIGITDRLRPRPGVWPVNPERRPERERWLSMYDTKAMAWAACRFVETIGSPAIHPKVAPVVDLHDLESGALSQRPIA